MCRIRDAHLGSCSSINMSCLCLSLPLPGMGTGQGPRAPGPPDSLVGVRCFASHVRSVCEARVWTPGAAKFTPKTHTLRTRTVCSQPCGASPGVHIPLARIPRQLPIIVGCERLRCPPAICLLVRALVGQQKSNTDVRHAL